jgi:hypothetical protein
LLEVSCQPPEDVRKAYHNSAALYFLWKADAIGLLLTAAERRQKIAHGVRSCERIMKQTSHHRDTEALRTEKKGPYLCASVSLWLM